MDERTQARMEAQANVFKALAHPSRIFVMNELAKGERCVCELTEMIGSDKSTVSKHLSILKQAGIITDEKRSNMVFYSLQAKCVLNFMACVEGMIETKLKKLVAMHAIAVKNKDKQRSTGNAAPRSATGNVSD
jgi:ArsR family transcriptional regulator